MPYTAGTPHPLVDVEALRTRIPGWGADLNVKDRPAVPQEQFDPGATGAHWDFPDRQEEKSPRERSIEHEFLTPVFGTSCPTKGLSGALRRLSYRRYSEARAAHWLILVAADRIAAWESHVSSLFSLHPDNPITETGVVSEFKLHGLSSRLGQKRADTKHQWLDPLVVAGPWVAAAVVTIRSATKVARRVHGR